MNKRVQDHPLYCVWVSMKQRCLNENNEAYARYGGRGIRVCARWLGSFENFLIDMGPRPANKTIERINNNGDYCPTNCRWASRKAQARNRRRRSDNTSGAVGVYWHAQQKKWQARIFVNGKHIHIGMSSSLTKAKQMRKSAEREHWG